MLEKAKKRKVLAIIAALNEEEGVGLTIAELQQYLEKPWVLVVDGWSRDKTVKAAKDMYADVIFQQGKGKGNAIAGAIKHVSIDVDYVLFTDADYTYPAKFAADMIKILDENPDVGMVCGNRFNSHFHLESMHNMLYFGNRLLAFIHNLLNGIRMHDPLTGLRVVRWEIIKDWRPRSEGFDVEVELNHLVERKGFAIAEIPIFYRDRLGEKKLKPKHGFTILKRILLESV
jgi:cellulose synthase/poly-beta-1,6-N-acetylglucosamine synthase-like glycosyltransferase